MGRLPRLPVLQDVTKSLFILNSFLFFNSNWTCLKFRESSGSDKGMGACAGRVLIYALPIPGFSTKCYQTSG
jgi:hypothetical protein